MTPEHVDPLTPDDNALNTEPSKHYDEAAITLPAALTSYTDAVRHTLEQMLPILNLYYGGRVPPFLECEALPDQSGIRLAHSVEAFGSTFSFEYHIVCVDHAARNDAYPELDSIQRIELETGNFTEEARIDFLDRWKRQTIHDPILNVRFTSESLELLPYQVEGEQKIIKEWTSPDPNNPALEQNVALAVMATGTGKTILAHKTWVDYIGQLKEQGESPGRVLFLVNNTTILRESAEKLEAMYPGKFRVGRIYEGEETLDADIIFATPMSLQSDERMQRLIRSGKISVVVTDEVHHLPAESNARLFRRLEHVSHDAKWNTKFLGLTATEVRSDRLSVLAFFNRKICFEYSMAKAMREGNLARFSYQASDRDIFPAGSPILDEAVQEYARGNRYSASRFPRLLSEFYRHTADLPYVQALYVAPTIDKAVELTSYYRTHGVSAIVLSSEQKNENPLKFEHEYYAWKNRQWPPGSPYAERPIPEVAISVDMFREGIDAPGVNAIFLWADTNSPVVFTQILGRGLRPAPFKTDVVVVDHAGLYHKAHLLHYIGAGFNEQREKGGSRSRDGDKNGDFNGPIDQQIQNSGNAAVYVSSMFSEEITDLVQNVLLDVRNRLEIRYGTYGNIPAHELDELDTYLASLLHLSNRGELIKCLTECSSLLNDSTNPQGISRVRDLLLPAMLIIGDNDGADLTASGTAGIAFWRLHELLTTVIAPRVSEDKVFRAFPEFDRSRLSKALQIGRNLAQLRTRAFGLPPSEMAQELYEAVVSNGRSEHDDFLRIFADANPQNKADTAVYLKAAEMRPDAYDSRGNQGEIVQDSQTRALNLGEQKEYTAAYSLHPRLKGKITPENFELSSRDFLALLFDKALITENTESFKDFQRQMHVLVLAYAKALTGAQGEQARESGEMIIRYVEELESASFWADMYLTGTRARDLFGWRDSINNAAENAQAVGLLDGEVAACHRRVVRAISDTLEHTGLQVDYAIGDGGRTMLRYLRNPERLDRAELILMKSDDGPGISGGTFSITTPIEVGRDHLNLGLTRQFREYYHSLPREDALLVTEAVVAAIKQFSRDADTFPVVLLELDKEGETLNNDLYENLIVHTEIDVLAFLEMTEYSHFNVELLKASRLAFLTDQYVSKMLRWHKLENVNISKGFARLYLSIHFAEPLKEGYEGLISRLDQCTSLEGDEKLVRDYVTQRLHKSIEMLKSPQRELYRLKSRLRSLTNRLNSEGYNEPLRPEQLINIGLGLAVEDWQYSPNYGQAIVQCRREVGGLLGAVRMAGGPRATLALPEPHREKADRLFRELIMDFIVRGHFPPSRMEEVKALALEINMLPAHSVSKTNSENIIQSGEENRENSELSNESAAPATDSPERGEILRDVETGQGHPPYFNQDSKLVFWVERTARSNILHWDPNCPSLNKLRDENAKKISEDKKVTRSITPMPSVSISFLPGSKKCCQTCQTPASHEQAELESQWILSRKTKGTLYETPE